jgi:hypothetical protein
MITKGEKNLPLLITERMTFMNNNCLCNLFNDYWVWLIVIAIILLYCNCGNDCGRTYGGGCGGCGCGC